MLAYFFYFTKRFQALGVNGVQVNAPANADAGRVGNKIIPFEKGEVAKAYVVCRSDVSATEDEILSLCRQQLAAYKLPRQVQFVDDLPKTSSGKILRRMLRTLEPYNQMALA